MKRWHVNWQDGMKVSKKHFQDMESAMRSEVLDIASQGLNSYNYGLIPPASGEAAFDLFVKLDQSNDLVLTLRSCKAIAPGGAVIFIQPEQQLLQEFRVSRENIMAKLQKDNAEEIYIAVHTNVFHRQGFGEPEQAENPPRQPFTVPVTSLQVQYFDETSHHNMGGNFQLLVGRLRRSAEGLVFDERYIPPCSRVNAHPVLAKTVENWQIIMQDKLLEYLRRTLRNIESLKVLSQSEAAKDDFGAPASPAFAAYDFSVEFLHGLVDLLPLLMQRREQPFLHVFSDLQRLSYRLWAVSQRFSRAKWALFQNYIKVAIGIETDLPEFLLQFSQAAYHHDKIDVAVGKCHQLFDLLLKLYQPESGLPVKDFAWKKVETETIEIVESLDNSSTISKK